MVLQRDVPVPVWGRAEPGERVCVSFAGQEVSTTADEAGDWQVSLEPMSASKVERSLTVSGAGSAVVFTNVVGGDVWLCSGQSNMERHFGWTIYGKDEFRDESVRFPAIRRVKIRKCTKTAPEPYEVPVGLGWAVASNAFPHITAVGYFFARRLSLALDVPIGIIDCSWSGSRIEPFISGEGFHLVPSLRKTARKDRDTIRYNAMIAPMVRFPIKGAIWYQGCANGNEGDGYIDKTEALVLGWRKAWGCNFPFYWVQLASYGAATDDPEGGNGFARIRDAQRKALDRIPGSGMAVAIDVGNPGDIHPKAKLPVGERLALWALAKDYGRDVVCSGPLVREAVVEPAMAEGGAARVRVSFDYGEWQV